MLVSSAAQNPRQRIVSLAPSVTSIILALEGRPQLVAVSKWCKDVADVRGLPELGDCWSLGAEKDAAALMQLRPTLIVGSVPFKMETVQKILDLPVPFLALNPRSLADVEMDIRTLGRVVNASKPAEALIREMRRRFERVRKLASHAKVRPQIYCEAWPNPRITSPPWVVELIEIAGGQMMLPPGARVSDEDVARANPEIIVLAWAATGEKSKPEQAMANPVWQNVAALRERRVFAIRDELLNTPGPPLVCGAEELLRAIHPQLATASRPRKGKRKSAAPCL